VKAGDRRLAHRAPRREAARDTRFPREADAAAQRRAAADVTPLRAAGLSDDAIEDAINVCALFNIYDVSPTRSAGSCRTPPGTRHQRRT